jgi:hypothetical protein
MVYLGAQASQAWTQLDARYPARARSRLASQA